MLPPILFAAPSEIEDGQRKKCVVLFPKENLEDYDILLKLLTRYLSNRPYWSLIELKDKTLSGSRRNHEAGRFFRRSQLS